MNQLINKKSAQDATLRADSYLFTRSHFRARNKKIQLKFPQKANPLFCTFDALVADYINKAGLCYLIECKDYLKYDLTFSTAKEVWIFYFYESYRELSVNLGYELLRHGAIKVLVDWFPLVGVNHDE